MSAKEFSEESRFFHMSSDLMFVIDSSGLCINANSASETLLGINSIKNISLIDFTHPDDRKAMLEFLRLTHSENDKKFVSRIKNTNKDYKSIRWSAWADVKNGFKYIYLIGQECVEDKTYTEIIAQQVIAFIGQSPASIALLDKEMKYIAASNQWVKHYLKQSIDFVGKSHLDLFPGSIIERYFSRVLNGDIIKEDDYQLSNENGVKEWHSFELRPWYTSTNCIGGCIISSENITFQKVAHAAVTEKSQMLNGILRNLPVIIYRINKDGKFTQCIGSGLKLIGYKDNEVVGRKAVEVFSDMDEGLSQFKQKGNAVFQAHGNLNKQEWHFENHIFPDNVSNDGIIGFAFDITDSVVKEKAMGLAIEKAETADKYKSKFLANMSHEIRTPLNAIIGFAEVFERRNLTEEQREHLHNITSSGTMLLKLIGDILDLSKIEEGKLNVECESFNIKELLSSDLLPYKYNANKKGLNFSLIFSEDLPTHVIGDSGKIKQVIINLIGNALKFTKEGGILINVSKYGIQDQGDEINIRFAVSDTGMGIPLEKQEHIFNSFTQADASIVKEYGGSGLGLSIVKQLVELMGGEIFITSPSNESDKGGFGSTFWFVLKLKSDNSLVKEGKKPKEEATKFNQEFSILVAEDNPMNQALAEVILHRLGCNVKIAENGEEAVDFFLTEKFDLILMDVQMPLMNGFQATEIIRNKYKSTIPIIGLTANVYKEDVEKCFESGMDDYLGKPYSELQLYQVLKKWVKQADPEQDNCKCTNLAYLESSGRGNQDFIKKMVITFLEQNEEFILNIEKALNGRDKELLKKSTHKIKSCYKMIGITTAEPILHEMETNLLDDNWKYLSSLVQKVKVISTKAKEELKVHI